MKGVTIALDTLAGGAAAALIVDGKLDDLFADGRGGAARPGTVFLAVADRPMKGQGGMTLRLPGGERGFLRQTRGIAPGKPLLVQVTGYAREGKAVPVTTRVSLRGRYCVVTMDAPGRNVSRAVRDPEQRARLERLARHPRLDQDNGLIMRSAGEHAEDDAVLEDAHRLSQLASDLTRAPLRGGEPERLANGPDAHDRAMIDWPQPDTLDKRAGSFARHGVDEEIDALRMPVTALPAGASFAIEPTRALIAVDVNTGADTSPAAGLKANIETARTLPRALRCRGLGGQITVDFAPSPKKDRHRIEQVLKSAFRADPVETALAGWTPLGHYELQRRHVRLPLAEVLR